MASYKVLKYFTKMSEGLKPYRVGDEIELQERDAQGLIAGGFIEKKEVKKQNKKAPRTKKGVIEKK